MGGYSASYSHRRPQMTQEIDYSAVRQFVAAKATSFFAECHKKSGEDKLVGLAASTDEDVLGLQFCAETQKSLKKRTPRVSKSDLKQLEAAGYTLEMVEFATRIEVDDWKFSKTFPDCNQAIGDIWKRSNDRDLPSDTTIAGLLNAFAEGLQDFEKQAALSSSVDRDDFLLLVWLSDSKSPAILQMAKQLNPPKLFEKFQQCWDPV